MKIAIRSLCGSVVLVAALALGLATTPTTAHAAPFAKQITFTQPGGFPIELWGKGDEFYAVFETLDGYTVVFDQTQRAYCYAKLSADGSQLLSTGIQVQADSGESLGLTPHLRISAAAMKAQIRDRFTRWDNVMKVSDRWSSLKAQTLGPQSQFAPPNTPTVGTKVGLCLLIDFSDDPATIPQADVDGFCNGDNFNKFNNNGSVKKYFQDVSNGLLTYSNVVTIYITAPQPKSYYNDTTKDCGDQANLLIKDVLDTMKALPDYATTILPTFDALTVDNNNEVIAFNVFYAGDNGGVWAYGLWPHSWGLYNAGVQELSAGGKKVFRYQITNIGNQLEIGTFCHENGHMLCGYPDLYDYTYTSVGAGMWCLMGSGAYGGNGGDPVAICAYLRRASGWAITTDIYGLSNVVATVSDQPGTNYNRFFRYQKPGVATEYYLMECRFPEGRDGAVPGGGVAVWHIDELGNNSTVNLNTNSSHNNYEATIVQADNNWDLERNINAGNPTDVYYLGNNAAGYLNQISDSTAPNARWWDGTTSGMYLHDFSTRSNTMTFIIGEGTVIPPEDSTDVAVRIAANPDPVLVNGNLYYTVTVTNNGNLPASDVVVTQQLSANSVFVSASTTNGLALQLGGVVTWTIGPLAGNAAATMLVLVRPTVDGIMYSSAHADTSTHDVNPANNDYIISTWVRRPTADLSVSLKGSPNPVLIGATLTYTVAVTNRGPSLATNVLLDTVMSANVLVGAVTVSQGTWAVGGTTVSCNLGTLAAGGRATATIAVKPMAAGNIGATSTVRADQVDPAPQNNVSSVVIAVNPAVDLGITIVDVPDPAVVKSNFTYNITVTNRGPSSASGVVLNQTLPAGVTVVTNWTPPPGVLTLSGSTLSGTLPNLVPGATAPVTVVLKSSTAGQFTTIATVAANQADLNPADNTTTATTTVALPFVSIVPAGATLTADPNGNGAIEPGETVTVQLRLKNVGNVSNTNLVATLLPTNGVTYVSGGFYTNSYGVLPPAGLPVSSAFTFKAVATTNGVILATLRLKDGGKDIGTATFTFNLPVVVPFANPAAILIPDRGAGSPYPSIINVAGITGVVGSVSVTLSNLAHTYPPDINLLVKGPTGQNVLLMSHTGGSSSITNTTVTLDGTAASPLPANSQILNGSYQPAAYAPGVAFPAPAPTNGYGSAIGVFSGANPIGDWSLYAYDDAQGDQGRIADGWSLQFKMIFPVNQIADISLAVTDSPDPVLAGSPLTYVFTILNSGPNSAANVAFTNLLPASLRPLSVTTSQGTMITNGNSILGNIGVMGVGATATVTVTALPRVSGLITNSAMVGSSEVDLYPGNNTAVAVTASTLPEADMAVGLACDIPQAVVGSNFTYTVTVTNLGPENALSVFATNVLPTGVTFLSASNAAYTYLSGKVICDFGDLVSGATGAIYLTVVPTGAGKLTNVVGVVTTSNDLNPSNNTATVITSAAQPAALIEAAGAALVKQSHLPPNGVINPGDNVTVSFSLANTGQVQTASLLATLLPTGGVVSPGTNQNYGALAPYGPAVARSFTFTAGSNVTTILATLQLSDGPNSLGSVTFALPTPHGQSFASSLTVSIPEQGAGNPYPSSVFVTGMAGLVSKVTVTLSNLSHSFPSDVNALLVSPSGQAVRLMSAAGSGLAVSNVTLVFDDAAASSLPQNTTLVSGLFKPTNYGSVPFLAPAPMADYGSMLADFNGSDPSGFWKLYLLDSSPGDAGSLKGWGLSITTVTPLTPAANLAVTGSSSPASVYVGELLTNTFQVLNAGPDMTLDVMLTNTLPTGATFVSASASQGTVTDVGGKLICDLGTLASGDAATLAVVLSSTTAQTLSSVGEAYSSAVDLNLANNLCAVTTTVMAVPQPILVGSYDSVSKRFSLTLKGQPNTGYNILASKSLASWFVLSPVVTDADGLCRFTDDSSAGVSGRFYRAERLP